MEVVGGEQKLDVLGHGAEARVWKSTFCGRPCVIKERVEKKYRHPQLEAALSKKRLNQEARCIGRARKSGVPAPCIYHIAHDTKRIYMSFVDGPTLKAWLVGEPAAEDVGVTMRAVGACVAKLHDADLIHGDLTSSNIMLLGDAPFIIDFGLACVANLPEDKAVDLYVMERALRTTHTQDGLIEAVIEGYRGGSKRAPGVLQRLEGVRARGRKRVMVG